ncbi:relaxase/mobilization nuclease domain-containing protein [Rhizobium sp. BT-226]|uniref:relaxase/mobilization nuclease domain-containing protein n=1 Tax=Rhizobium sp. BT-226 TaxID=2986922 RepID=UPI0021F758F7|nr:relaxase/mobilization nuclease domain-containing protein [Rhizobium sp. BT-226]MCW0021367.1 relaxase/mobilization nuclease domain-containing protein [Rhizobium sp. BT-226]
MSGPRQAIVHIPRNGGCKSIKRLRKQLCYLDQDEDVVLELSERHGGAQMSRAEYEDWARLWAEQTGHYLNGESLYDGEQDLTTHIIVSFPPGTDHGAAYAAGRAWAEDVFGSGRNGGEWDYITAFHTNRPHPHVHVIVNRRSLAARGEWLAISHRNRFLNYDTLRETLADAAWNQGIELDATSRGQRGLQGRGPTTAEYRRQARVEFRNHFEEHHEVVDLARDGQQEVFPELTGRRPVGDEGGGPSGGAGASRDEDRRQATGSTIPVESQREAENARDDRRSQERRRRAEDELEAGPSRRREPQPSPFPEDNSDLYEMPLRLDRPDYDTLAARQLRGEMTQANASGGNDGRQAAPNPIPVDSRQEAEDARDLRRSQSRERRAADEVEAGPSRRRVPQPTPSPEDDDDLYADEPSWLLREYDLLAARQINEEMPRAEEPRLPPGYIPNHELYANLQRMADDLARNGGSGEGTSRDELDPTGATGARRGPSEPSSESDDVEDQIRREMAEYRERQVEASRRNREIEESAAGPSRRRRPARTTDAMSSAPARDHHEATGAGAESSATTNAAVTEGNDGRAALTDSRGRHLLAETIETRGQQIRRRSDERAASRERQRALEESEEQADGSETETPPVETTPSRTAPEIARQPEPVPTNSRQANRAVAGPDPSQPRAIPAVAPEGAAPDEANRRGPPEVRRTPPIERDRNRTR